ncbi:MAG: DUF3662 and FHA domain-containing protein [Actinobacteria bacterium]|nr:DUF3662 and FHA domain-containing protein [Actinomycetota bacterium]
MGVLQDFERRLEGAVEGFFARAFRSGVQPIELAKALQRYAEDTQHVTEDGVLVPNVYRFTLHPKDLERLETIGDQLPRELADVVARTAEERGWRLRGPIIVRLREGGEVSFGMYELAGRVEAVEAPPASPTTGANEASSAVPRSASGAGVRLTGGTGSTIRLSGGRVVAGRLPDLPIALDDPTVSREHAAFVLRGRQWWVVDLGSTNGTRVNGTTAAEHPLEPGDRVELGEAVVEFVEL